MKARVADEVWIATALLHREHPERTDFTVAEIVARAREEKLTADPRPGVYVHVVQHSVANRRPNPARYRMLVETGRNRRRLFRPGDAYHPAREGGKSLPDRDQIPPEYHELLNWYAKHYAAAARGEAGIDPLLALRGTGRDTWAEEPADEYVRRLRASWT